MKTAAVKKLIFLSIAFAFSAFLFAQDKSFTPKMALKWAPTGLILGDLSLQGEYNFLPKSSLTAKIGIPLTRVYHATFDNKGVDLNMKSFSFLAGYRRYFSKRLMRGFYIEPFFTYAHHTSDGTGDGTLNGQPVTMDFTNEYNGVGVGAQLGSQFFIGKRFVIDLFFLGPQVTSSRNNFKAIDRSNSASWTTIQADEAEQDIITFLNQFPFIKNNVNVNVDKPNRTVTADFKGALVGVRFGISVGVAL
jgi:hypothetical protein